MIYFAQIDAGKLGVACYGEHAFRTISVIKIGCSGHVTGRVSTLSASMMRPVTLMAVIEGGFEEEAALHERFDHLRVAEGRYYFKRPEWFYPTRELMEFIGSIQKQSGFKCRYYGRHHSPKSLIS